MASLTTAFVFFWGLDLRLISGERIVGLSLVLVFVRDLVTRLPIGILLVFHG